MDAQDRLIRAELVGDQYPEPVVLVENVEMLRFEYGLDTDGDEQVNFEEFLAGDLPLLSSLDSDENGVVTLDEFLNARPGRGASRRGDDDRPEREIDEERAAEMQERMLQRAEERFAAMDNVAALAHI